ncbi:MAG: hypothetical protein O7B26_02680, partial [Planctomycetota bacterium]|nr:hypothetical protein [Planctomycetota bacterium]
VEQAGPCGTARAKMRWNCHRRRPRHLRPDRPDTRFDSPRLARPGLPARIDATIDLGSRIARKECKAHAYHCQ